MTTPITICQPPNEDKPAAPVESTREAFAAGSAALIPLITDAVANYDHHPASPAEARQLRGLTGA